VWASNWPIGYSGAGRCDYAAGGSVRTCLQRSAWDGWRDVACKTGYIDFSHPEVHNAGVGSCHRGTYTYRVKSDISISTPHGYYDDFAISPTHRWTCP
jgi:hypothetical protein